MLYRVCYFQPSLETQELIQEFQKNTKDVNIIIHLVKIVYKEYCSMFYYFLKRYCQRLLIILENNINDTMNEDTIRYLITFEDSQQNEIEDDEEEGFEMEYKVDEYKQVEDKGRSILCCSIFLSFFVLR